MREVVETARDQGFDVHIVSGDVANGLESVAERVGIPTRNVHASRSSEGRAEMISALHDRSGVRSW